MKARRSTQPKRHSLTSWIVPPTPGWHGAIAGYATTFITFLAGGLTLGHNLIGIEGGSLFGAIIGYVASFSSRPIVGLMIGIAISAFFVGGFRSPIYIIFPLAGALSGLAGTMAGINIRERAAN